MTAVAIYDKIVRHAATDALLLLVVFSRTLYAPPFKGNAPTTSLYIFLNKKSTSATISSAIHAYCPAYMMVSADTYKQEEVISLPQIAVAGNSLSFLIAFIICVVVPARFVWRAITIMPL